MWEPCGPLGMATSFPSRRSRRTRIACSRSGLRRTAVPSTASGSSRGSSVRPWSAASAGRTNSENVTTADTGLPGQPEYERRSAAAEPGRLTRLERDSPEHLLDAELGERRLDVIVRADRNPARDDHDVGGLERLREPGLGGRAIVGESPCRPDDRALRGGERIEHRRVRIVDLARAERLAGGAELVARAQDLRPRAPVDGQLGRAGGDRRAQLGGAEQRTDAQYGRARAHVFPGAAQVVADGDLDPGQNRAVVDLDVLLWDHRGGAVRDRAAGGDPDRAAVAERRRRGGPGARLADHGQGPAGIPVDERVAVHSRARERRHVAGGSQIGGENPITGLVDRDPLGSERSGGAQHPLAGFGDRNQRGRHRLILADNCARLTLIRMDDLNAW